MLRSVKEKLTEVSDKNNNLKYVWEMKNNHYRLKQMCNQKTQYLLPPTIKQNAKVEDINKKVEQMCTESDAKDGVITDINAMNAVARMRKNDGAIAANTGNGNNVKQQSNTHFSDKEKYLNDLIKKYVM